MQRYPKLVAPLVVAAVGVEEKMKPRTNCEDFRQRPLVSVHLVIKPRLVTCDVRELQVVIPGHQFCGH